MSYRYILRKYKLPREEDTGYRARQQWETLKQTLSPDELEKLVVDELPIQDKPKGWLQSLKKQIIG